MNKVEELLSEADNNYQRVSIVEQFLLSKIRNFEMDLLVCQAVKKIQFRNGSLKIKELARKLNISDDVFEKRFRKTIGSSPKQFAFIVRMSSIVQHNKPERLLDIALNAGYYDQSHFNKDFKTFTGQTPSEFYKSASFW